MSKPVPDPYRLPATRILATLGPASMDPAVIRELVDAGASAFRLNFSHADYDKLAAACKAIRDLSQTLKRPLAILGDLSGPKLRTGKLEGDEPVLLEKGEEVVVVGAPDEPTRKGRITVTYTGLARTVSRGQRLLLDDGNMELEVLRVHGDEVHARVLHGGPLKAKKGLNLPGCQVDIPAITEKDAGDLEFALENGVDWLALSFVQTAKDVVDLKGRIAKAGHDVPVIAKIEKPIAVENLDHIMEVSDGIMVARGDLGVEVGPEELPVLQKRIIGAARRASKLVITATQMLDSMTNNPRPTRAEASDVANAIFDGTDVVMLSQETAVGSFPVRTVETMREIAVRVETSELYRRQFELFQRPEAGGVAHAAIRAAAVAAEEVDARALVLFTSSGWTALSMAAWRPDTDLYVVTTKRATARRLALCWGVRPVIMPPAQDLDDMYVQGMSVLLRDGLLHEGDLVVVVSGSVVRGAGANTIKISRVGTDDLTDNPATRERLRRLSSQ